MDGNGVGGVDKVEDRILLGNCRGIVGTEDRREVVVEDFGARGKMESCSHAGESHMQQFERTIRDSRRMRRSMYVQKSPLSIVHENGQMFQTSGLTIKIEIRFL